MAASIEQGVTDGKWPEKPRFTWPEPTWPRVAGTAVFWGGLALVVYAWRKTKAPKPEGSP